MKKTLFTLIAFIAVQSVALSAYNYYDNGVVCYIGPETGYWQNCKDVVNLEKHGYLVNESQLEKSVSSKVKKEKKQKRDKDSKRFKVVY